jgi:uncharacterized protein
MEQVKEIVEALERLEGDKGVPKNAKVKISEAIKVLKGKGEVSLNVSKALSELDEISTNTNIDSYTRSQIWNIVSLLEKV